MWATRSHFPRHPANHFIDYSQCLPGSNTPGPSSVPPTTTPTTPTPTSVPPTTTTRCSVPRTTGPAYQASSSNSWAYGSFLQRDKVSGGPPLSWCKHRLTRGHFIGQPVLGPKSSRIWFQSSLRIIGLCPYVYGNVDQASTSYKPLSFDGISNTSWSGTTALIQNQSYSNFVACTTDTSGVSITPTSHRPI